jgi:RNA polymerase sigma-70 factor (ECF subfamily)
MTSDTTRRFCCQALSLSDELYRRARHITGNHADAEDLVQDTLIKAFVGFDKYREENKLRAWMFRIMYTTWIDKHRARQYRPTEVLTGELAETTSETRRHRRAPFLRSAEEQLLDAMPDTDVAEALLELPMIFREAVYLADVHGYRTAEIADLLGIPVGTVLSRLHRGRTKLRALLAESAKIRGYDQPA